MQRTKLAPALTRDVRPVEIYRKHARVAKERALVDVADDIARDVRLACLINVRARG